MSSNNYNCECNQSNCPFKTDPFDPYKEVCVKCGKKYSFRRDRLPIFLMMWLIVAIVVLMNDPNRETENQPEIPPPSTELGLES